jgi:hypothetical protein
MGEPLLASSLPGRVSLELLAELLLKSRNFRKGFLRNDISVTEEGGMEERGSNGEGVGRLSGIYLGGGGVAMERLWTM